VPELSYNGVPLEEFAKQPRICSACSSQLKRDGLCSNLQCPEPDRDLCREEGLDTRTEHIEE
jgi:hypothetical protein